MAHERPPASAWTLLTRRGQLALSITVALTAAVALIAVQTLTADSAPTRPGGAAGATPSTSTTDPSSDPPAGSSAISAPGAASPARTAPAEKGAVPTMAPAGAAPVVVNGRVQPPRVAVPAAASGLLVAVSGATPPVSGQRVWTYRVEVEQGLPFAGAEFAAAVDATLADPRSWAARGHVFQRLDTEGTDFRLILASPALTDQLCAPLNTRGEVSCRNGDLVVLNALRWAEGIADYAGDLASYREYMVNHEVGHRIGRGHVQCTGSGDPAPVMMQQTYGLDGCLPNPWPLPDE